MTTSQSKINRCSHCNKKISIFIAVDCSKCSKKLCFNCLPYEAHQCVSLPDVVLTKKNELHIKLNKETAIPKKIDVI